MDALNRSFFAARHTSQGGEECPACRSKNITVDGITKVDGDSATATGRCSNCGTTWESLFKLWTIGNIEIPDESKISLRT